ncbi:MAG: hypothetical protein ACTHV2_15215 [Brachybacterium sp.]|uniref:hypothetical protein n=1 Tax=Brachybacterium sp. TaxID=1891286 RepID=UPI003F9297E1
MADWKTYAKAARNTARKQAPGAKDAARRASGQANAYVRAAGKAIDEGHRPEGAPRSPARDGDGDRVHSRPRRDAAGAPRTTGARSSSSGTSTAPRPAVDGERLRKDAAAYYTVASRRVASVNVVPRAMRALRDAMLIGLSLFVIWGVLAAAGIPIPFTTVLIIVGVIVVVSFAGGLYAQWKRSREVLETTEDPRES